VSVLNAQDKQFQTWQEMHVSKELPVTMPLTNTMTHVINAELALLVPHGMDILVLQLLLLDHAIVINFSTVPNANNVTQVLSVQQLTHTQILHVMSTRVPLF
jgi:hypothetical protein